MKQITSYGFNMDTACVELRFSDETAVAIDTITVENKFAETWLDRRELNYLIYNDPLGYCVFRSLLDTRTDVNWTVIPVFAGHWFR